MMKRTQLASAICSVLFNYLVYVYLEKMELLSCHCEVDLRAKLLKSLIPLFIFVSCAGLWLGRVPPVVGLVLAMSYLIFDITMLSYLTQLRSPECGCSEQSRQYLMTHMLYYFYFLVALIVLTNLSMMALVMATGTLYRGYV